MKAIQCRHAACAKPWKRGSFGGAKPEVWRLAHSRRSQVATKESSAHSSSFREEDMYAREAQATAERLQPLHAYGSAYGSSSSFADPPRSDREDTETSTDRSLLVNWSRSRSRSESRLGGRAGSRARSPSPEPRPAAPEPPAYQPASVASSSAMDNGAERRGRTLRRRRDAGRDSTGRPIPQTPKAAGAPAAPAPAAPAAVSAASSGRSRSRSRATSRGRTETYRSPSPPRARSRSRARSPSPAVQQELAQIKSWLSKDSSPSPSPRPAAATPPTPASTTAAPGNTASRATHASAAAAAAAAPSTSSVSPSRPTSSPTRLRTRSRSRSRTRARSPSPVRHDAPDHELEKMKVWLQEHNQEDPLAVKPYELVARGHSPSASLRAVAGTTANTSTTKPSPTPPSKPAAASKPSPPPPTASPRPAAAAASVPSASKPTPAAAAPAAPPKPAAPKPESSNGVIDLSHLPASQRLHVREVDVMELPQTHSDYGRALKQVTEVASMLGWAKAKKREEELQSRPLPRVEVVVPAVASTSEPQPQPPAARGPLGSPSTQAAAFSCLSIVGGVVGAGTLMGPEFVLHMLFGSTPSAVEATLMRMIGSGAMLAAFSNYCLQDAASHNRLGSATYQRLMAAGVWHSLACVAALAFHTSLCTPALLLVGLPLALAGVFINSCILYAATGSPLPPSGKLDSPTNATAITYTLLCFSLLFSSLSSLAPLGLIHGTITLHLPLLHHLCAPGLLAMALVASVLQDAANRGRLGASTFKRLNLGLSAALGALALSLAGGMKQLLVVPTLTTLPVVGVAGAAAVFCLFMFAFSEKKRKPAAA